MLILDILTCISLVLVFQFITFHLILSFFFLIIGELSFDNSLRLHIFQLTSFVGILFLSIQLQVLIINIQVGQFTFCCNLIKKIDLSYEYVIIKYLKENFIIYNDSYPIRTRLLTRKNTHNLKEKKKKLSSSR